MGSYSSTTELGQSLNLLRSILTILLTYPNNDTLLCYSNDPFLTVCVSCLCADDCCLQLNDDGLQAEQEEAACRSFIW